MVVHHFCISKRAGTKLHFLRFVKLLLPDIRCRSCADKCKNLRNKERIGFHGSRKKISVIHSSTPTNSTPVSVSKCLGMIPKYT